MRPLRAPLLCGLLALAWGLGLAQTLPRAARDRIVAATVFISHPLPGNALSTGTGTLIGPQGLVLTSYHVIGDLQKRQVAPRISVGVVRFVDQPPEVRYLAEVVAADPALDLALLRIVRTLDGRPLGAVRFPAVPLGDSDRLSLGDPLFVFGFRGTGGSTITFSSGAVGGFTGEDMAGGGRRWVKHDAQTGPGNSGGGIYDETGQLVGVHTRGVSGQGNSRTAFMRPAALVWGLIGPQAAGVLGTPPAAGAAPPEPGAAWPPPVNTGQTWRLQMEGEQGLGDGGLLTLSERDHDGAPKGTALFGEGFSVAAYFHAGPGAAFLDMTPPDGADSYRSWWRCRFEQQAAGASLRGTLQTFKTDLNGRVSDLKDVGACTATLNK